MPALQRIFLQNDPVPYLSYALVTLFTSKHYCLGLFLPVRPVNSVQAPSPTSFVINRAVPNSPARVNRAASESPNQKSKSGRMNY